MRYLIGSDYDNFLSQKNKGIGMPLRQMMLGLSMAATFHDLPFFFFFFFSILIGCKIRYRHFFGGLELIIMKMGDSFLLHL